MGLGSNLQTSPSLHNAWLSSEQNFDNRVNMWSNYCWILHFSWKHFKKCLHLQVRLDQKMWKHRDLWVVGVDWKNTNKKTREYTFLPHYLLSWLLLLKKQKKITSIINLYFWQNLVIRWMAQQRKIRGNKWKNNQLRFRIDVRGRRLQIKTFL